MLEEAGCPRMSCIYEILLVSISTFRKMRNGCCLCSQTIDCFSPVTVRVPDVPTAGTPPDVRFLQIRSGPKSIISSLAVNGGAVHKAAGFTEALSSTPTSCSCALVGTRNN